MRFLLIFSLIVLKLSLGVYVENIEFDLKVDDIITNQFNGDPTILKEFLLESGDPKGLKDPSNLVNPSFCFNIDIEIINDAKYKDCTVLESKLNRTTLRLKTFSGFETFLFALNLVELKNIEIRLENQDELTYLYFSAFRKCDNCLFFLAKNPSLVGIKFGYLYMKNVITTIPVHLRPKLFIRGNAKLKLKGSKTKELKRVCNPVMCEIQVDDECHFRSSIRESAEYKQCPSVYGDMIFTDRFQEVQPYQANFVIDGCFIFNNTGIRFVRPFLRAHVNCKEQHIFERNKFMCTDQINELIDHWGKAKVKVISNDTDVNCYQGECRGGFLTERQAQRFVGCEILQGPVYISSKSGNIGDRIRDVSNAHVINGQFQLVGNSFLEEIPLPFLRSITSKKCPALHIANMPNLRTIVFHPNVQFKCNTSGPAVVISNTPRLHLHQTMKRQIEKEEYVFRDFDYGVEFYGLDKTTIGLVIFCVILGIITELIARMYRSLLLPNAIYHFFPIEVRKVQTPKTNSPKPKNKKD